MDTPKKLCDIIAKSTNLSDLLRLEKALNMDLIHIARKIHESRYNAVVADINHIEYDIKTPDESNSISTRLHDQRKATYVNYQYIIGNCIGYYLCDILCGLRIDGKITNIKDMVINEISHNNRLSSGTNVSNIEESLVNRTWISVSKASGVSIRNVNWRRHVTYPWSQE